MARFDFSDEIAVIARNLGVDAVTVHEAGSDGQPDEWQLEYAMEQSRCVVTKDSEDFVDLATEWAEQGRDHTGILLVSRALPGNRFTAIARGAACDDNGREDAI